MSADNYNLVKRVDGHWRVWLNLSASCDRDQNLALTKPQDRTFSTLGDAVEWANEQGYTEYGTEVDEVDLQALRRPADHDGIPMCSHLVCPRYGARSGGPPICLDTGAAPPADLCLPAVSEDLAVELVQLRVRARKQPDAEMRRLKFATKLGAAAYLVKDVAGEMVEHEAEHSEDMFDGLFEIAAKLERGKDLMVTDDEWSWE